MQVHCNRATKAYAETVNHLSFPSHADHLVQRLPELSLRSHNRVRGVRTGGGSSELFTKATSFFSSPYDKFDTTCGLISFLFGNGIASTGGTERDGSPQLLSENNSLPRGGPVCPTVPHYGLCLSGGDESRAAHRGEGARQATLARNTQLCTWGFQGQVPPLWQLACPVGAHRAGCKQVGHDVSPACCDLVSPATLKPNRRLFLFSL